MKLYTESNIITNKDTLLKHILQQHMGKTNTFILLFINNFRWKKTLTCEIIFVTSEMLNDGYFLRTSIELGKCLIK